MSHAAAVTAEPAPRAAPGPRPVLLNAYAARSCPVKTQNAFDPRLADWQAPAEESSIELFDGGRAFQHEVLDRWAGMVGVVDLRDLADRPEEQQAVGRAAVAAGAAVLIGWRLPADVDGHRVGRPDALVRGADRADGRPGYHPVAVKWHKIVERFRQARPDRPARVVRATSLEQPAPSTWTVLEDCDLRVRTREADFLQLAHYHRMLEAHGVAAGGPALAAVIGTDDRVDPRLAWVDLDEPLVRTFSRSEEAGWRLRSLLERYDHEHAFRVDIAARAADQRSADAPPLLVAPIVNDECGRCQWWEHCRPQLDAGDVSLRIDKGPLDAREIVVLRRFGVATITDLATADLDALGVDYLPEVRHRAGADTRLRVAARRARMLLHGAAFERETEGPIDVVAAAVEVDVDVESSASGRIYLWGFLVDDGTGSPRRRQFARFRELDDAGELELAAEALGWLHELADAGPVVRVYHYSAYETAVIAALAARSEDPALTWAHAWTSVGFVDLLETVKQHYFGAAGLGLKAIARQAGFRWRDEDPGGLNSQIWFAEAVHGEAADQREAAARRVLEYNEDDVIATHRLRAWLRAQ